MMNCVNTNYLLLFKLGRKSKRQPSTRKSNGPRKRRDSQIAAHEEDESDDEVCVPCAEPPKRNTTKKSKKAIDDEEEEVQSQEEALEVEPDEEDLGEEYDLSQYVNLVGKLHYDPDDDAVYKCHSITVVGDDVVVYRCKYDSKAKKWGKVNMRDPIHIGDILGYHNNTTNEDIVNARLQEPAAAAKKQRGRPNK